MEFNAGIIPFTGTSKSPLNMFPSRLLTISAPVAATARASRRHPSFNLSLAKQELIAVNLS